MFSEDSVLLGLLGLGTQEILLILLAVLVLFGARKIPEFARGLGQGIREFRNATNTIREDIHQESQPSKQPSNQASNQQLNQQQNTQNTTPPQAHTQSTGREQKQTSS